jgi:hypothetical protein
LPLSRSGKRFFFAKKKNQKTLAYLASAFPEHARLMSKSFCCFFQKEALSSVVSQFETGSGRNRLTFSN